MGFSAKVIAIYASKKIGYYGQNNDQGNKLLLVKLDQIKIIGQLCQKLLF